MTDVSVQMAGVVEDDGGPEVVWSGEVDAVPAIGHTIILLIPGYPKGRDPREGSYRVVDVVWRYRLNDDSANIRAGSFGADVIVERIEETP